MAQLSSLPTRKVGAGALAGALSLILVWLLNTYAHAAVPAEIAASLTTLLSFVTSYFVTEA